MSANEGMMMTISLIVVGFVLLLVAFCLVSLHRSINDLSQSIDTLMLEKYMKNVIEKDEKSCEKSVQVH